MVYPSLNDALSEVPSHMAPRTDVDPHLLASGSSERRTVDHPPHYNAKGIEAIDVIEAFELSFRLGNAVKYVLRAGRKGGPDAHVDDLKKARWYLDREIAQREEDLANFKSR